MESEIIECDVLIIGSGGAGCRAAIEVSENGLEPLIVSKGLSFKSGCTGMAEGGYNAVLGTVDPDDSFEAHYIDTIKGGSFLNDSKLVEILVKEAPKRLIDLENYGAIFDRKESGEIDQRPFGGQSYRRTCYHGDRTGLEIITALKEEIIRREIQTMDEIMITSLIVEDGVAKGALGLNLKNSETIAFKSKSIILATGGAGNLYPITSNPVQKCGDGYALAWNAGADLLDMEQVQFHPTGMVYPESMRGVLVTEAVRAEGGILLNKNGERFMKKYDQRMELATRDVVSRAIYTEIMEGRGTEHGGVYLDVTHLPAKVIEEKLESMFIQFKDVGIDIREEPMEVAPTAHHFMGGVRIDEWCRTNIKNLFAAGEVAGGVHGANRLGGNALAETQVFGKRAGEAAAKNAIKNDTNLNKTQIEKEEYKIKSMVKDGNISPTKLKEKLQKTMWENVSIIRNKDGLKSALKDINEIQIKMDDVYVPETSGFNKYLQEVIELRNMITVAKLVIKSALIRKESRGAHFREDYPQRKDNWQKSIVMNKNYGVKFIKRKFKKFT